jgi:hypothetical protein
MTRLGVVMDRNGDSWRGSLWAIKGLVPTFVAAIVFTAEDGRQVWVPTAYETIDCANARDLEDLLEIAMKWTASTPMPAGLGYLGAMRRRSADLRR